MKIRTHYGVAKRRRDSALRRCAAMRAAKARKRQAAHAGESGKWPLVRSVLLRLYASPDGRSLELRYADGEREWLRVGSERALRGKLARVLWRAKSACAGNASALHCTPTVTLAVGDDVISVNRQAGATPAA